MTKEEKLHELFKAYAEMKKGGHQREGQALFNALRYVDHDFYDKLTGSDADCFYNDKKINNFFEAITSNWRKY